MTHPPPRAMLFWFIILVSFVCGGLFFVMAYGGIRTADGEVVFRVGCALANNGSFAVERDLEAWPGFALPRGVDGRRYSALGPAQSVLLVPFIWVAETINSTRWYEHCDIPISFAADGTSLKSYILKQRPSDMKPHALRFLVSFFNIFVAIMVVVLQLLVVHRLTGNPAAGFLTALLLGLATPLWHYSGTMFSEPLAIAFSLGSFYIFLDGFVSRKAGLYGYCIRTFSGGFLLGLGVATHITVILSVPFFLALALYPIVRKGSPFFRDRRACAYITMSFIAGLGIMAALYGWYNYARFGSFFEEGRRVPGMVHYGTFVLPWEGLVGLLASPGKGLLWFCPLLVVSVIWWKHLHRRSRYMSIVIASMALFRLVFIASRSDWHGGFCLGPRLMLLVVPFLLLPIGCRLAYMFEEAKTSVFFKPSTILAFFLFFACMIQQLYFCLGEPVSFYYMVKMAGLRHGVSVISSNQLYFHWSVSPLLHLWQGRRGPFLLQSVQIDNYSLFVSLAAGIAAVCCGLIFYLTRLNGRLYKA